MTSIDSQVAAALRGSQRLLFYVRIFHSQEDMGSLGKLLPADQARREFAEGFWSETTRRVQELSLPWPKVMVYQDGLPDTKREIVDKIIAEVRSPNYDLLRWLAAQGATVHGTESPALMKEEYEHLQAVLTAADDTARAAARQAYVARAATLLAERDAYIARRIADTLAGGGIGLLFIGQVHLVAEHLPAGIAVRTLDPDESRRLR